MSMDPQNTASTADTTCDHVASLCVTSTIFRHLATHELQMIADKAHTRPYKRGELFIVPVSHPTNSFCAYRSSQSLSIIRVR